MEAFDGPNACSFGTGSRGSPGADSAGNRRAAPPSTSAAPSFPYAFDLQLSDTIDCSQFNPAWAFNDNFVDFFHVEGRVWLDQNGNPTRDIGHWFHVSNDVNSVTGFTLHEHNHYTLKVDFTADPPTLTLSGAINIMQRRSVGEVIQNVGHKVINAETDEPIVLRGPNSADDQDFCAAVAP
jgi:hypothetical protein